MSISPVAHVGGKASSGALGAPEGVFEWEVGERVTAEQIVAWKVASGLRWADVAVRMGTAAPKMTAKVQWFKTTTERRASWWLRFVKACGGRVVVRFGDAKVDG